MGERRFRKDLAKLRECGALPMPTVDLSTFGEGTAKFDCRLAQLAASHGCCCWTSKLYEDASIDDAAADAAARAFVKHPVFSKAVTHSTDTTFVGAIPNSDIIEACGAPWANLLDRFRRTFRRVDVPRASSDDDVAGTVCDFELLIDKAGRALVAHLDADISYIKACRLTDFHVHSSATINVYKTGRGLRKLFVCARRCPRRSAAEPDTYISFRELMLLGRDEYPIYYLLVEPDSPDGPNACWIEAGMPHAAWQAGAHQLCISSFFSPRASPTMTLTELESIYHQAAVMRSTLPCGEGVCADALELLGEADAPADRIAEIRRALLELSERYCRAAMSELDMAADDTELLCAQREEYLRLKVDASWNMLPLPTFATGGAFDQPGAGAGRALQQLAADHRANAEARALREESTRGAAAHAARSQEHERLVAEFRVIEQHLRDARQLTADAEQALLAGRVAAAEACSLHEQQLHDACARADAATAQLSDERASNQAADVARRARSAQSKKKSRLNPEVHAKEVQSKRDARVALLKG